jgi:tetratricopeptide (TPR) repeat protein
MSGHLRAALGAALFTSVATTALAAPGDGRFRQANELARAGDYPKAMVLYQELAASGPESASLYWNWAQAAAGRGMQGEALWALLRARELDPGDHAVARDIERLREALNLDPAEITPEPLGAAARFARRFRLDLLAAGLLVLSVIARLLGRALGGARWPLRAAWAVFVLGFALAAVTIAGSLARPTATVVRRGAALVDAASPSAEAVGSLREGEVVPVLQASGDWLRVEDNAGARGWARAEEVRRLDAPPPHTAAP